MSNSQNTSTGYLIVSVSTARTALPIENALVTVYSISDTGASELIYNVRTNRSGQTAPLPLAAPPISNSLSPNKPFPYARYSVRVDYDGFYPVTSTDLTIFPDIVATLPVFLVPLEEFLNTGEPQVKNFPNHGLNTAEE